MYPIYQPNRTPKQPVGIVDALANPSFFPLTFSFILINLSSPLLSPVPPHEDIPYFYSEIAGGHVQTELSETKKP